MVRPRPARTGAGLQGATRFDHADLRCRGRCHRSDRGPGETDGVGVRLNVYVIPGREANLRCALAHRGISRFSGAQLRTVFDATHRPGMTASIETYFCAGAIAAPPVGAVASAVLVDLPGCGCASLSTAELTNRSCVGLDGFASAI